MTGRSSCYCGGRGGRGGRKPQAQAQKQEIKKKKSIEDYIFYVGSSNTAQWKPGLGGPVCVYYILGVQYVRTRAFLALWSASRSIFVKRPPPDVHHTRTSAARIFFLASKWPSQLQYGECTAVTIAKQIASSVVLALFLLSVLIYRSLWREIFVVNSYMIYVPD